ncbi:MAG: RNA polymerase sigma factor [Longimicrobiales bacterium]|nr:RNA polymerase sigma factor [Longimicrobiales bacterium]
MTHSESIERSTAEAVRFDGHAALSSPTSPRGAELTAEVERELIRKCRAGDARWFEPLVYAYEGPGMRVAVGMMRDPDAAHDALQESFVKVFRKLDHFDLERSFGPWFFQILRNQCRDMLRSRRARARHEGHDERLEERPAGARWDPGRQMERSEATRIIWEGLEVVGEDQREILVLKELEDFRYHEIAEILDIPEGTVASRLYHARRALREALIELGYAGVGSGDEG